MPDRPLYPKADLDELPQNGNAGLWYDKFCNQWTNLSFKGQGPKLDKEGWIATVTKQPHGDREELHLFARRQGNLVEALSGQWLIMRATGPFVTGLGRDHPVENGFLWHHTLGVPYLPGSSIKGMVGAWIEQWLGKKGERERLLGSQKAVGEVVFFDALPVKPVEMKADVMTPHYAGWNKKDPPGDWRSPVPIPFLTVREATTFCFAIVPRQPSTGSAANCEKVCGWLRKALNWIGAGAKTAVGYGRFEEDKETRDKLRREEHEQEKNLRAEREKKDKLANLSPVEREIEKILESRQNKQMPEHTAIMGAIRSGQWKGDDKVEAAKWVRDKLKKNKKWKENPTAKIPRKDKEHQNTLVVMGWLDGK